MRGDPATPRRRPDRVRHPLHPQAAGGPVADLVHPRPRRPRRRSTTAASTRPTDSGSHLAALPADRLERRRGGHDGRPGRTGADPGVIEEAVACRLAVARIQQEFRRRGMVLRPLERPGGPRSQDRQAVAFAERPPSCWRTDPSAGCCIPGESLARLRGRPGRLVHARSDQVRHRLPRHEAAMASWPKGIPADIVTAYLGAPRHRPLAHDRPHGAVPVLRRASPRGSGARCSTPCSTSRPTTTGTLRSPRSCPTSWRPRRPGMRGWGSRTWAMRCGPTCGRAGRALAGTGLCHAAQAGHDAAGGLPETDGRRGRKVPLDKIGQSRRRASA